MERLELRRNVNKNRKIPSEQNDDTWFFVVKIGTCMSKCAAGSDRPLSAGHPKAPNGADRTWRPAAHLSNIQYIYRYIFCCETNITFVIILIPQYTLFRPMTLLDLWWFSDLCCARVSLHIFIDLFSDGNVFTLKCVCFYYVSMSWAMSDCIG